MKNLLEGIERVLLMGPGPSTVPDAVYQALSRPTLGYLDAHFIAIMDGIKELLQRLFVTGNRATFPLSGTGMAGMEACLVNLLEPRDRALVAVNGVFGRRMVEIATRLGAKADVVEAEWGTALDVDRVSEQLEKGPYKLLAVVHAETSTGVRNPIQEIGALVAGGSTLFLVDAVTSLGGLPLQVDEWGIDAVYSASQKCLSCPPGLSPLSFSERAMNAVRTRAGRVPSFYMDMTEILPYWEGEKRVYHHTAPINMLYAFYQALLLVFEEGPDKARERHRRMHRRLIQGLGGLGLEPLVAEADQLPMLTAVKVPSGVDEAMVRRRLRTEHLIEIGAGLGPLAGKIWRVGLMGHTAREESVDRLIGALKTVLGR